MYCTMSREELNTALGYEAVPSPAAIAFAFAGSVIGLLPKKGPRFAQSGYGEVRLSNCQDYIDVDRQLEEIRIVGRDSALTRTVGSDLGTYTSISVGRNTRSYETQRAFVIGASKNDKGKGLLVDVILDPALGLKPLKTEQEVRAVLPILSSAINTVRQGKPLDFALLRQNLMAAGIEESKNAPFEVLMQRPGALAPTTPAFA